MNLIKTKPFLKLYGLLLALLLSTFLILFYGIYAPSQKLRSAYAKLSRERTQRQAIVKLLTEQQSWIEIEASLAETATAWRQQLLEFHRNQQYLRLINEIAKTHNLQVSSLNVKEQNQIIDISFAVTGQYNDIVASLFKLETYSIPLKLQRMAFDPSNKDVEAEITLFTWRPVDEEL